MSIPWLGVSWRRAAWLWLATLRRLTASLATIALMPAIAFVTRSSGTDLTLGLALTHTGPAYALFAPLLGWLDVALTGSDASSNAMFDSPGPGHPRATLVSSGTTRVGIGEWFRQGT